jgi:alcohol dehydrogenase (NADP+)
MCASDLHTLRSGWHAVDYPQSVGHEIVGRAVRVGSAVTHVRVGDRVGVSAQSDSCGTCKECSSHQEQYSPKLVTTYSGRYADGSKAWGGYADFSRVPGSFVTPIPEGIPSKLVAPMLCGGITVYWSLKTYGAGTQRKDVGVIRIGGLGHYVCMRIAAYRTNLLMIQLPVTGPHVRKGYGSECHSHLALAQQEGGR